MSARYYVLDSSAIMREPSILSIEDAEGLYIPSAVVQELGGGKGRFEALINEAAGRGATLEDLKFRAGAKKPNVDAEIVAAALSLHHKFAKTEVFVVTLDGDLFNALHGTGVKCITPQEFLSQHKGFKKNTKAQRLAQLVERSFVWKLLYQVFVGVACIVLAYALISNFKHMLSTLPVWGTVVAAPVLGTAVFWFRQSYRLGYGIAEFGVGLLSVYSVLFPRFDYAALSPAQVLQIVAGVYILVRGLDNIGKGVERTRYAKLWQAMFRERS